MFKSKNVTYYRRSQCALHHSILSFCKIVGMNVQEQYEWIICYKLFCTSCHWGALHLPNNFVRFETCVALGI